MKSSLICAAAFGLALPLFSSADLLVNGNFESGDTGQLGTPLAGWSNWGVSGWHHGDTGKTMDTKAMKFWWDDAGIWQDVPVPLGAEVEYGLSALNHPSEPVGWNLLVRLEFYSSAGGPALGIDQFKFTSAAIPSNQWISLSDTATAPANADVARIVINMTDWFDGVSGSWNYDNAFINVVPEPATLALISLSAIACLSRRPRRI